MAINKADKYPGRWETETSEFPLGKPKNRTTATAKDGTYFEKDWLTDHEALFASIFSSMGKTISTATNAYGDVDEVGNSQAFRALKELIAGGATLHTDSGTANAYALTSEFGEAPELFDGIEISFIPTNSSTGSSTINVNGNGIQDIVLNTNGDAVSDELEAGKLFKAYYDLDNTRWIVSQGVSVNSGSTRSDEIIKIITQDSNAVIYPDAPGGYADTTGSFTSPTAATHLIVNTTDGLKLVEIKDGPATGTIAAIDTTTYPMTATIGGTDYDLFECNLSLFSRANNLTLQLAELTNTGATFSDGVLSYRTLGATYINELPYKIEVTVSTVTALSTSGTISFWHNGVQKKAMGIAAAAGNVSRPMVVATVEPGASYRFTTDSGAISYWSETH